MSNERWTQERYEAELDQTVPNWRAIRRVLPCTCDYENCHGWAAPRFADIDQHIEEEADRVAWRGSDPEPEELST